MNEFNATHHEVRELKVIAARLLKAQKEAFHAEDPRDFLQRAQNAFNNDLSNTLSPERLKRLQQMTRHKLAFSWGGRLADPSLAGLFFEVDADLKTELRSIKRETEVQLAGKVDRILTEVGNEVSAEERLVFDVLDVEQKIMTAAILGNTFVDSWHRKNAEVVQEVFDSEGEFNANGPKSFNETSAMSTFLNSSSILVGLDLTQDQTDDVRIAKRKFNQAFWEVGRDYATSPKYSEKFKQIQKEFVNDVKRVLLPRQRDELLVLSTRQYLRIQNSSRLVNFLLGPMKSELDLDETQTKTMTMIGEKTNKKLFATVARMMGPIDAEMTKENMKVKRLLQSRGIHIEELMGPVPKFMKRKFGLSLHLLKEMERQQTKKKKQRKPKRPFDSGNF